jgi:broad specificity phosphatase PhoE
MPDVRRHTQVWLVRHPQTDWNKARRYQGRTDRALTPFGQAQPEAVACRLRRIPLTAIVSSGLVRTDELAGVVVTHQGRRASPWKEHSRIRHVERDERWREADHGAWEGLTYADVVARYPAETDARFSDPWHSHAHGSESMADLWTRVEQAWHDLLRRHDGGRILVATHATPIQLLLCAQLQIPFAHSWQFRVDLAGITCLDLYPTATITRVINEVPPLRSGVRG